VLEVRFDWLTIHWIAGLVLTVAVIVHIFRALVTNRLANMWAGPSEITAAAADALRNLAAKPDGGYRPGKYSVAQILFHFGAAALVLATIVTGLVMLKGIDTPLWERDPLFVSEAVRGVLFVIHGLAALFLVTLIMLHIYFAFRPEKIHFLRSMLAGWITEEEYSRNHDPEKWQESVD